MSTGYSGQVVALSLGEGWAGFPWDRGVGGGGGRVIELHTGRRACCHGYVNVLIDVVHIWTSCCV
jgi:hypothetical protein